MEKRIIAYAMTEKTGFAIREELIIELPDDGCPGHMGLPHWKVYAARAGEFTIIAYAYADGNITVHVM